MEKTIYGGFDDLEYEQRLFFDFNIYREKISQMCGRPIYKIELPKTSYPEYVKLTFPQEAL